MAHYAFLDENNIVTEVITGIDETELIEGLDTETWYANFRGQTCKRTSYHTSKNQHKLGGIPFRGNYAGRGMFYDENRDVFYLPQPFPSWTYNEETCEWIPPKARPNQPAQWNENTQEWSIV